MKALSLVDKEGTRQALLALAKQVPGAWLGIKIAALLLVLEGQRRGRIAALLGLGRTSLERWVHEVNQTGAVSLVPKPHAGRPPSLSPDLQARLKRDLEESPHKFGLPRAAWDGPMLVVHLKERFGVKLEVRQAQNWMHRLGYSLKRASYVYVQARKKDARSFRRALKKTASAEPPKGDHRFSG
jgi:transposase